MTTNFENRCQIYNEFISIGADKKSAKPLADSVLKYMTDEMKLIDPAFEIMSKGANIAGSYADDLKITKPNEFDYVLKIKLPHLARFKLVKGSPGYAKIDASCLWSDKNPNNQHAVSRAKSFLDADGYVRKEPFGNWIHWLLDKVFDKLTKVPLTGGRKKPKWRLDIGMNRLILTRERNGPAHTLGVDDERTGMHFDIDMVMVLEMDYSQWLSERCIDPQLVVGNWHLVPKPTSDGDLLWITSYAGLERKLISDKNKKKVLIRYFKKMRDTHDLTNLKSYYIKTMFLWQDDIIKNRNYWNQSIEFLFFEMFDRMLAYVEQQSLPFFWDKNYNMFSKLTNSQLIDLSRKLLKLKQKLLAAVQTKQWHLLDEIFLTREERNSIGKDPSDDEYVFIPPMPRVATQIPPLVVAQAKTQPAASNCILQ